MNPLKIEQSSFFGIFIPGAFLLINIVYTANNISNGTDLNILSFESGLSLENGLISFVLAVILGFVLRMLPYEYSDWFRKTKFPYFDYYFNRKWNNFPKYFRDYYDIFAQDNYPEITDNKKNNKLATMDDEKAKYMINNLKVSIFKMNSELKDEILFHEGASRLAVGTLYALVLSLILIVFSAIFNFSLLRDNKSYLVILISYILTVIVIYMRLPQLRGKEVRTILEAYAQKEKPTADTVGAMKSNRHGLTNANKIITL